jgi:hypothetical protein
LGEGVIPLTVYRNCAGAFAVSIDEERIILPSGRLVEITEAWEEVDEDFDPGSLTPEASRTLAALVQVRAEVRDLKVSEAELPEEQDRRNSSVPAPRRRKCGDLKNKNVIWLDPSLFRRNS